MKRSELKREARRVGDESTLGFNRPGVFPYTMIRQLGKGSFGTVSIGEDRTNNEFVVVKKMTNKNDAIREIGLYRYLQGGATCNHLSCYREHFAYKRSYYLVQTVVGDTTLYGVRLSALSEKGRQGIVESVAKGVAYLHRQKIVHGDVKPPNIVCYVAFDGKTASASLVDYGGGCILTENGGYVTKCSKRGAFFTPGYTSPDMAREMNTKRSGEISDFTKLMSDVYAIGMSFVKVAIDQKRSDLGLPDKLTYLLTTCLSVDPKQRPTAHQLARAFKTGKLSRKSQSGFKKYNKGQVSLTTLVRQSDEGTTEVDKSTTYGSAIAKIIEQNRRDVRKSLKQIGVPVSGLAFDKTQSSNL